MKVTYDDIWKVFVLNCLVDKSTLPQTEEGMIDLINAGVDYYNSVTEDYEEEIICNDMMENINLENKGKANKDRIRLIAFCIRHRFLENNLIEYEAVWQPLIADIGQKFYRDQIKSRQEMIDKTDKEISRLLNKIDEMRFVNG